jgi:hypothetical protein
MNYQSTFKRYELKYMLTEEQLDMCLEVMAPHMKLDEYGLTTIRNIYYDTDNYRLIRKSIEKPVYKEKLRVRSYRKVNSDENVYVELKKKYESVVYKRRLALLENQVMACMNNNLPLPLNSQIASEIDTFRSFYGNLKPAVYLSYDRLAYYSLNGSDFRVTFDRNILVRTDNISLTADVGGTSILPDNRILMEVKTSAGIPLWLSRFLTENQIYRTSFSKYGCAYENILFTRNMFLSNTYEAQDTSNDNVLPKVVIAS